MSRGWVLGAVGVALCGLIGAALVVGPPGEPPPPPPPPAPRLKRSPGHRTPLPPPPARASAAARHDEGAPADPPPPGPPPDGPPPEGPPPPEGAASDPAAPLPEKGTVDPDVPFTPENIQAAMAEVIPEIQSCVQDWTEALDAEGALGEGGYDGRLVLEMALGPEGVESAAISDIEGVPPELLGCFSGVVYEAVWPAPDARTDIRYPIRLTSAP